MIGSTVIVLLLFLASSQVFAYMWPKREREEA